MTSGASGRCASERSSVAGAYFSRQWIDPKEKLVTVFLSPPLLPSGGSDLKDWERVLANQAIENRVPETSHECQCESGKRVRAAHICSFQFGFRLPSG